MSASDADVLRESMFAQAEMIHALRARVAELEKDAARYRWLRGEVHGPHIPMAQVVWKYRNIRDSGEWVDLADGPSLDAAIDAALVDALPETPPEAAPGGQEVKP